MQVETIASSSDGKPACAGGRARGHKAIVRTSLSGQELWRREGSHSKVGNREQAPIGGRPTGDCDACACNRQGEVDEAARAKNRIKSRACARAEHVFCVVKCLWGFSKVRYRGLAKNATRAFTALVLANICLG